MLARERNRLSNEFAPLNQQTVIRRLRLQNYRRNVGAVLLKDSAYGLFIVKGRDQGFRGHCGRNARARTGRFSGQPATRFYKQGIDMAVIATFEFENFLPPGRSPRHPQRAHHGFRAG